MRIITTPRQEILTKSEQGLLFGVCQGIAEHFAMKPWTVRLFWIASMWFFGFGFLAYFLLIFLMPKKNESYRALEPKILGVCLRISNALEVDVVLVRLAAVFIALGSLGTTVLLYVLMHFILPQSEIGQGKLMKHVRGVTPH